MLKKEILLSFLFICWGSLVFAQEAKPLNADDLIAQQKYQQAIPLLKQKILNIYDQRVADKRVPVDFITIESEEEGISLIKLFNERKVDPYFKEENPELFKLHAQLAQCYYEIADYDSTICHLRQAFRFHQLKEDETELIYLLAKTFLANDYQQAYLETLEFLCRLENSNEKYVLELGQALAKTKEKREALFWYKQYFSLIEESDVLASLWLEAASLAESCTLYLDAEKYYLSYLKKEPKNSAIIFSLATMQTKKTGHFKMALVNFEKALNLLPENDFYRRSKSLEFSGDIYYSNLKYQKAIIAYQKAEVYQQELLKKIKNKRFAYNQKMIEVGQIKAKLLKVPLEEEYKEFLALNRELEILKLDLNELNYYYSSLNSGLICWNIAECYSSLEEWKNALEYYQKAILLDYNSREAHNKIKKLKLKISRGF